MDKPVRLDIWMMGTEELSLFVFTYTDFFLGFPLRPFVVPLDSPCNIVAIFNELNSLLFCNLEGFCCAFTLFYMNCVMCNSAINVFP